MALDNMLKERGQLLLCLCGKAVLRNVIAVRIFEGERFDVIAQRIRQLHVHAFLAHGAGIAVAHPPVHAAAGIMDLFQLVFQQVHTADTAAAVHGQQSAGLAARGKALDPDLLCRLLIVQALIGTAGHCAVQDLQAAAQIVVAFPEGFCVTRQRRIHIQACIIADRKHRARGDLCIFLGNNVDLEQGAGLLGAVVLIPGEGNGGILPVRGKRTVSIDRYRCLLARLLHYDGHVFHGQMPYQLFDLRTGSGGVIGAIRHDHDAFTGAAPLHIIKAGDIVFRCDLPSGAEAIGDFQRITAGIGRVPIRALHRLFDGKLGGNTPLHAGRCVGRPCPHPDARHCIILQGNVIVRRQLLGVGFAGRFIRRRTHGLIVHFSGIPDGADALAIGSLRMHEAPVLHHQRLVKDLGIRRNANAAELASQCAAHRAVHITGIVDIDRQRIACRICVAGREGPPIDPGRIRLPHVVFSGIDPTAVYILLPAGITRIAVIVCIGDRAAAAAISILTDADAAGEHFCNMGILAGRHAADDLLLGIADRRTSHLVAYPQNTVVAADKPADNGAVVDISRSAGGDHNIQRPVCHCAGGAAAIADLAALIDLRHSGVARGADPNGVLFASACGRRRHLIAIAARMPRNVAGFGDDFCRTGILIARAWRTGDPRKEANGDIPVIVPIIAEIIVGIETVFPIFRIAHASESAVSCQVINRTVRRPAIVVG